MSVSSAAALTVGKTLTDYKKKVDEEQRMKQIEIESRRDERRKQIEARRKEEQQKQAKKD